MKTLNKITVAKEILSFGSFAGYKYEKNQIVEITEKMISIKPGISDDEIKRFFNDCKSGINGMIYQSPVSLMVAFKKYFPEQMMP